MYNLLIGGAAGQGIETTAGVLQKLLKRSGYHVFTVRDFMSRVRGGHNFSLIRFGSEPVLSHCVHLDGIIAFDEQTIELHMDSLKQDGFLLCDSRYTTSDERVIKLDLAAISKEIGNPRVTGSILIGAVLKLFGENLIQVNDVLKEYIREQYLAVNEIAVQKGYELTESRFLKLQTEQKERILISGSQALALGAIAAGLRFYSAYPMSPATPVMEYLASKGKEAGVVVEQAEDEIAAINMAIGASFAGTPAMTGTSGGGFSLMVEALGLSGMAEIPLVVADVQRPGPVTGLPTRTEQSDLKFVISASQGEFPRMVIALRNHTDAFYQTVRAFHMAEKYQIPVIVLSDQYLGDSSATVEPYDLNAVTMVKPLETGKETEEEYLRYRITSDGISLRLIPGKSKSFVTADSDEHDERGWITEDSVIRTRMMDKRMGKLTAIMSELQEPEFFGDVAFDTLLLGWGSTYGPILEAVQILNNRKREKYASLIFGDIYPLPQKVLKEKALQAKKIINIEQNATGQLADLIREKTGIVCNASVLKYDGRQITAEEIMEQMERGLSL